MLAVTCAAYPFPPCLCPLTSEHLLTRPPGWSVTARWPRLARETIRRLGRVGSVWLAAQSGLEIPQLPTQRWDPTPRRQATRRIRRRKTADSRETPRGVIETLSERAERVAPPDIVAQSPQKKQGSSRIRQEDGSTDRGIHVTR